MDEEDLSEEEEHPDNPDDNLECNESPDTI